MNIIPTTKILLISSCACFVLGSTLVGTAAWKYQSNKYEHIISEIKLSMQKALNDKTQQVLKQERVNASLTDEIERQKEKADQERASLLAANYQLMSKYNGLRFNGSSCKQATGASSQASSQPQGNSGQAECVLPAAASQFIVQLANKADELEDVAQECKAYANAVEEQRNRMIKEQDKQ